MSSVSLSLRVLSKRPAGIISRSLATTVDSPSPLAATPAHDLPIASTVNSAQSQKLPAATDKPTPYHPFVHVPLLKFTTPALREANPSTPEQITAGTQVVPLPSTLFNTASRPSLLHRLVISHLASLRMGNASTKNRSEVNYSGKKIRPQKGTGKARLGSRGSPMLTGGGRAFGPRPKGPDGWARKVNRKETRLGLRVGLSDKWRSGDLCIVENLGISESSTRSLQSRLLCRGWGDAVFVLAKERSEEAQEQKALFELASRNLTEISLVTDAADLGIWDIVKRKKVVMELSAVDEVINRLDPEGLWNRDVEEDWEDEEEELDEETMAAEFEEALEAHHQASL